MTVATATVVGVAAACAVGIAADQPQRPLPAAPVNINQACSC